MAVDHAAHAQKYSQDDRNAMATSGEAMPDGSFPIKDSEDLEHAVHLVGLAHDPYEAKRHIKKRAQALGLTHELPKAWESSSMFESDTEGEVELPDGASRLQEVAAAEISTQEHNGNHVIEATLIRSGRSKMGNIYPASALKEAVHLFEGARAFVDHNHDEARPERSVRDLVGHYSNVSFDGSRIRGRLNLIPGHEWLFSLMRESEGNPNLCGLSIDAWADQDRATGQVRSIYKVDSVDIVTKPSAGGQFDRIVASERSTPTTPTRKDTPVTNDQGQQAQPQNPPAQGTAPTAVKETDRQQPHLGAEGRQPAASPNDTQPTITAPDLARLVEQITADRDRAQSELARVQAILDPSSGKTQATDPTAQVTQLVEEVRRERDLARAEALLSAKLTEAQLPSPVEAKLRKQFSGRLFEATTLDDAISTEKDMLSQLTSAGIITGMGGEKPVHVGMSELDQIQAAFDKMFGIKESDAAGSVPAFSGIREAFHVATGFDAQSGPIDRTLRAEIREALSRKVRAGHLTEAETHLREADVTNATFSFLLGTSMNKRLLADYQAWPSEWQKFATIVGIKDFKLQNRIRLGAFGSLSTVAEDAAYTTLTLSDTQATYTPTKRGNIVQITRETIVNDDLYAIKQIPQKLAVAAAFTLAEFIYGLLSPNGGNIYDGFKLFDTTNHLNTGIATASLGVANSGSALSSAALQAAVVKMRKQTNLASKPIGLKPRYLLVPPDLEFTAMTILKSAGLPGGNNNDINPMMGYAEPIVAPQLNALTPASTSVWMAIADPQVIDTLEVGFVGGQANPVLLIQDMPLYGLNFTQDVISYKVRHEYGGAVVDYRGFYLGNN